MALIILDNFPFPLVCSYAVQVAAEPLSRPEPLVCHKPGLGKVSSAQRVHHPGTIGEVSQSWEPHELNMADRELALSFTVRYDVAKREEAESGGAYPEEWVVKLHFDENADAIYLQLGDSKIIESEEINPGIVLDFNEPNQVAGIEILSVKDRSPLANLSDCLLAKREQ
jgi:uncharacterized protein YuzE